MSFSPQSRVWVYQSNRKLNIEEVVEIQQVLNVFTAQWKAHGHQLTAKGEIIYNCFIVLTVDEATAPATGCSIDASVKLLKEIQSKFDLDLFNRFNMAYKMDDEVYVSNKKDFETLISINKIDADTVVFNNMVQNLAEFEQKWEVPLQDSWHNSIFADQLKA